MTIKWQGLSYFKIKHGKKAVLIDPLSKKKYDVDNVNAANVDICLLSSPFLSYSKKFLKKSAYSFKYPGEYEARNISVKISPTIGPNKKRNNAFTLDWENNKIVHLGVAAQKRSVEKILEDFNSPDVLMIPVGGDVVLSADDAIELVHQIEPKIVIPMFYKTNKKDPFKLDDAKHFIKEMGQEEDVEVQDKFTLKKTTSKKDDEKTKLVLLKP